MVSSNVLLDSIQIEIGGDNEWPDDAKLFQPYETEQILMPDSANCLAVQAFLQMANLKYEIVYKANAAEMSPTGRVPFIKVGQYLVAELEPIVAFVQNKNISLTSSLTDAEKSDMRAYMSLINTVFGNAENYVTWCDSETYNKVTKKRFGSIHPFPLNHILLWKKRSATIERMKALGGKTEQDAVLDDVDLCCQSLSDRLGDRDFFFKSGPTELDCLLYAHVSTILNWPHLHIGNLLAQTICKYPKLVCHGIAMKNRLCLNKSDVFSVYGPLITIYNNICSSVKKKKIRPEDGGACHSCKDVVATDGRSPPLIVYANSSDSSRSELCSSSSVESSASDSDCRAQVRVRECGNKGCNHARSSLNKEFRSDVTAYSSRNKGGSKGCNDTRSCSNKEFSAALSCHGKKSGKGCIDAKSCLNKTFRSDIVTSSCHRKKGGCNDAKSCSNEGSGSDTSSRCVKKSKNGKAPDAKSKQMHVRIREDTIEKNTSLEMQRVCTDEQIASNLAFENASSTPACSTPQRESSCKNAGSKRDSLLRFESLSFLNCPQLFNICGSVMDAMRIGCLAAGTNESTVRCKNDECSSDDKTTNDNSLPPVKVENKTLESCDDNLSLSGASSSSSIIFKKTEKVDVKLFTNETDQRPCIKLGQTKNRSSRSTDDDTRKSSAKKSDKPRQKVKVRPRSEERRTKIDISYYDSNNAINVKSGCFRVKNSEDENVCDDRRGRKAEELRNNRGAQRSKSKSQCRCSLRKCLYGVSEKKIQKTDRDVSNVKVKREKITSTPDFPICSSSSSEDFLRDQIDKSKSENIEDIPIPSAEKTLNENLSQDEYNKSKMSPKVSVKLEQETCVYVDQRKDLINSEQKSCLARSKMPAEKIENSCPLSNPDFFKEQLNSESVSESVEDPPCIQIVSRSDKTTNKSICREKSRSVEGTRKNQRSVSESLEDPPCFQIAFDDKTTDRSGHQEKCRFAQGAKKNPKSVSEILEDPHHIQTVHDDKISNKSGCHEKNSSTQKLRNNSEPISGSLEDLPCFQIGFNDKTMDKSGCRVESRSAQGGKKNPRSVSEILEDPPHTQTICKNKISTKSSPQEENIPLQEKRKNSGSRSLEKPPCVQIIFDHKKTDESGCQKEIMSAQEKEKSVDQKYESSQQMNLISVKQENSVESNKTRSGFEAEGLQILQVPCDVSAESDKWKKTVAKVTHIPVPVRNKLKENEKAASKVDAKDGNLSMSFSRTQKVSKKTPTTDIKLETSSHSKLDIKRRKSLSVNSQDTDGQKSAQGGTCSVIGASDNTPKEEVVYIMPSGRKASEKEHSPSEASSRKSSEKNACQIKTETHVFSHTKHGSKKCTKTDTSTCEDDNMTCVRDHLSAPDTCDMSSIFVNKCVKNSLVDKGSPRFDLSLDSVSSDVLKVLPESGSECDLSVKILEGTQGRPPTMSMNNVLWKQQSDEEKLKLGACQLHSRVKSPPQQLDSLRNRSASENLKPLDSASFGSSLAELSETKPSNCPVSKLSVRQNLGESRNFAFTEDLDTLCTDSEKPANLVKNLCEIPSESEELKNGSVSEDSRPLDVGLTSSFCDQSSEAKPSDCPISKISVSQNLGESPNFAFTENLDTCTDSEKRASLVKNFCKEKLNESGNLKEGSFSEDLNPLDSESTLSSSNESSEAKPSNCPVSKLSVRQNLGERPNFAFTENLDTQCVDSKKPEPSTNSQKAKSKENKPGSK